MERIYDLIIIGGGPAGLSSGIYAGRAKLDTLILDKGIIGGQASTTSEVANYPGVRNTSGPALMEEMKLQALDFGVEILEAEVLELELKNEIKWIKTNVGEFKTRAITIATGASPRKLGFPGEKEFTGRGVAYCATCDGEFFTGMDVFVIGAGFAACEEGMHLTKYARKVTIISRDPELTVPKSIAEKVFANNKMEVIFNTSLLEVTGDNVPRLAKFKNLKTDEIYEFHSAPNESFGVFVFIGYTPQTELFKGLINMDAQGYILTDENMMTNIKGVYAVGDLRPKVLRQIVTAVADGATASTHIERFILNEKHRLGIEHEAAVETKTQEEAASGVSEFLTDEIRVQLQAVFQKIEKPVTLVSIVEESNEKSIELKNMLIEVAKESDKLKLDLYKKGENVAMEEVISADKFPIVALMNQSGEYSGVKFHGVPGGHEFNSFILAIYNLGGPGQAIENEIVSNIQGLTKKTNVKVAVSLSCHLCPDVVVATQRIAMLNKHVEAEMVDISLYNDLKTKHNIMSVPAIIVNDEKVYFGAKKIDEIIDLIA